MRILTEEDIDRIYSQLKTVDEYRVKKYKERLNNYDNCDHELLNDGAGVGYEICKHCGAFI